jgi:hypothetical protein
MCKDSITHTLNQATLLCFFRFFCVFWFLFVTQTRRSSQSSIKYCKYYAITAAVYKEVAKLVSTMCREIDRVVDESYLYMVANDTNSYFASSYAKVRAGLVRHYFSSWLVGFSTVGAIFALYLTLVQTASGIASALDPLQKVDFGSYLKDSMLLPFSGKPCSRSDSTARGDESL